MGRLTGLSAGRSGYVPADRAVSRLDRFGFGSSRFGVLHSLPVNDWGQPVRPAGRPAGRLCAGSGQTSLLLLVGLLPPRPCPLGGLRGGSYLSIHSVFA